MRICSFISTSLIIVVLASTFLNVPMYGVIIPVAATLALVINLYNSNVTLTKIVKEDYVRKVSFLEYAVYIVTKKQMGNHNVATVGGKNPVLFVEEKVYEELSKESMEAIFLHEAGHMHQIDTKILLMVKHVGMIFTCVGLHSSIYGDSIILEVMSAIGCILVFGVMALEKRNEYKADLYALQHGAEKEAFIKGLLQITEMNGKMQININHPALQKRIEKIKAFES